MTNRPLIQAFSPTWEKVLVAQVANLLYRRLLVGLAGRLIIPRMVGDEVTRLKFSQLFRGKLESPYVVSYFMNGLLGVAISHPVEVCARSIASTLSRLATCPPSAVPLRRTGDTADWQSALRERGSPRTVDGKAHPWLLP